MWEDGKSGGGSFGRGGRVRDFRGLITGTERDFRGWVGETRAAEEIRAAGRGAEACSR